MSAESRLIDGVVGERGFATEFPHTVLRDAALAAKKPLQAKSRADMRKTPFVTIDGKSARDFDDAVFCKRQGDGFCLRVAIADVAAYVPHGSALDLEARRRAVSVYLPDRVLPMLPSVLSDDVCSLNPDEDKLTLVCDMHIENGEVQKYHFVRAVVRSARRLTYEDAYTAIQKRDKSKLGGMLSALADLAAELHAVRQQQGAFFLERAETQAVLAADGVQFVKTQRNDAHKLIEECMLAANRCAADLLIRRRLPALHRIHKKPPAEGVAKLRAVLRPLGVLLPQQPQARDFATVIDELDAQDPMLTECLLPVVLGALARAEYAPDEKTGHFGLACRRYLHFTSPIRRYPDLLTHRTIIAALEGTPPPPLDWKAVGEHCSQNEVTADKAGWDCLRRLLCLRAQSAVGLEFDAFMSGGMRHGMFVNIPELGIDGMVHVASLPGFWRYDESTAQFIQKRSGRVLSPGMRLRVRLTSINPDKGRSDCAPLLFDESAAG